MAGRRRDFRRRCSASAVGSGISEMRNDGGVGLDLDRIAFAFFYIGSGGGMSRLSWRGVVSAFQCPPEAEHRGDLAPASDTAKEEEGADEADEADEAKGGP